MRIGSVVLLGLLVAHCANPESARNHRASDDNGGDDSDVEGEHYLQLHLPHGLSTADAGLNFAFLPDIYLAGSLLPEMNKGHMSVCAVNVEARGTAKQIDAKLKSILSEARNALNTWNGLMKGADGWTNPSLVVDTKVGCDDASPTTIKIQLYRANGDAASCTRSCTDPSTHTVYLRNSQYETSQYVVLHEFGHTLGLGDTYSEAGYIDPIGQVPSVMNGYSFTPSKDDKSGLRQVFVYTTTGKKDCGPNEKPGAARGSTQGNVFCVPKR